MYVEVYRNLHKGCFSVKHKGKVIQHTEELILKNAKYAVQPAGRLKVLKTNQKNVHAFVRGELLTDPDHEHIFGQTWKSSLMSNVTYNPYIAGDFLAFSGLPILKSDFCWLYNNKRIMAINERPKNAK